MDPKFTHIKGIPALADFVLPMMNEPEIFRLFVGLIDAAKQRSVKETLERVFTVLDGVTFTAGNIEMKTEQLKKLIEEAIK